MRSHLLTTTADLMVVAETDEYLPRAQELSQQLGCSVYLRADADTAAPWRLTVGVAGVALEQGGKRAPGPVRVDFASGAADHRRKFGGGKGQLIAKAVGLKGQFLPVVLDATAGLGGDAFVLANLGCRVHMLERSPVVHALLADGLVRAQQLQLADEVDQNFEPLAAIAGRMSLTYGDALSWLSNVTDAVRPDVVYFDPMFPERKKAAQVNKAMQAFHTLVGEDLDAAKVLQQALAVARYRVVVKRPRLATDIGSDPRFADVDLPAPSHQVVGKTSRYDVYTLKKLPL